MDEFDAMAQLFRRPLMPEDTGWTLLKVDIESGYLVLYLGHSTGLVRKAYLPYVKTEICGTADSKT